MLLNLQDVPFCGLDKESCVAKQTLNDKNCLVTCDGLYADVEDDSLKKSVQTLTQELRKGMLNGVQWGLDKDKAKESLLDVLQQLLPSAEEAKIKALTKSYHKYKREYVKHLLFNPNFENLSKYSLAFHLYFFFSCDHGARTTSGSVHLF